MLHVYLSPLHVYLARKLYHKVFIKSAEEETNMTHLERHTFASNSPKHSSAHNTLILFIDKEG